MGAMPEEIDGVVALLGDCSEKVLGQRTFFSGKLAGVQTVVVFSRWGKVAAAATASALILEFGVTEILFTGVAGALSPDLNIGDIVLAKRLIQHDMDARPLMPRFEIPLLGKTYFEADAAGFVKISQAIEKLLESMKLEAAMGAKTLAKFGIAMPKLHYGDVASGDVFFAAQEQKDILIKALPQVLCVEMEGAALAQVCYEYGIPFNVIRTISDAAGQRAHLDFPAFIKSIASHYSTEIIRNLYQNL